MSNYIQKCIDECIAKNPGEVEFHQTVEEVLTSLAPVIEQHPEYEEAALLERLTEPERRQSTGQQGLQISVQQCNRTLQRRTEICSERISGHHQVPGI